MTLSRLYLAVFVAFLLALLWAKWPRAGRVQPAAPTAARAAGCEGCHPSRLEGPHAAVACVDCHLGDPAGATAEAAHAGLEAEPGALDRADESCGSCHPDELRRVRASVMTEGRGLVAVDRWAFGEIPAPEGHETLADVLAAPDPSPAQAHLRQLCAGCHLGTRRDNRDDAVSGGSGCSACHAGRADPRAHPSVDAEVPDERCAGCHGRSARIALSYAGFVEGEVDGAPATRLADGRSGARVEPDLHRKAGMACVDCHLHTELMGDGLSHAHQEEQVELRCESCHRAEPVPWPTDPVTLRISGARTAPRSERALVGARGTPLWNVREEKGWTLRGKLDGKDRPIVQIPAEHAPGHERLSCQACHAQRAPWCADCHTEKTSGEAWDFGVAGTVEGAWVESHASPFTARLPALGVDPAGRIRPAIPGMVAELAGRSVRSYALLDPHTSGPARSCVSCHRDPVALGLGQGELDPATLRFSASARDGWTTLFPDEPGPGTRVGARSLDAEEQRRVLRVGVCLGCHAADEAWWTEFATARVEHEGCAQGRGWWNEG